MTLYSDGRTTGLVVECGHGLTQSLPIYEGNPQTHGKDKSFLGGHSVNKFLAEKLGSEENVQAIKEQACFVAADYEAEKGGEEFTAKLPDGKEVKVSGEFRCAAPELLFNPL